MDEPRTWAYPKGSRPPHPDEPLTVGPVLFDAAVLTEPPRTASGHKLPTGAQRGPSKQEQQIAEAIVSGGYPEVVTQYRFARHLKRQYRFDFAWPSILTALEYEGGIYAEGWHQTPGGYTKDAMKYNLAAALGWRIYRVTAPMLKADDEGHSRLGYWLDVMHGRVVL